MIDLFSGIGGFSLAAKWAGIETVHFVEKDQFCKKVLAKNFPNIPIHNDIKTFTYNSHVDLITGGFPCQPFSVSGKKKGNQDDRYLWPEFFRIIRECNPLWIIAENVNGIINMELDNITNDLENEGYEVKAYLIPASGAGAPHKRERLWIVANSHSFRHQQRSDSWKGGHFQVNFKQYAEEIQQKWTQFKPESWETFSPQDWCESITRRWGIGKSFGGKPKSKSCEFPIPGMVNGVPPGVDRGRSLGNAIVPQVVFPILAFIKKYEEIYLYET